MYGIGTSIEESSLEFVLRELSLFKRLSIIPYACVNPLASWHIHEGQFLNFSSLAKQTLGILGSQMETKHEMSLVGMLIDLKQCCF
jgi:hypothetical protein